MYCRLRPNNSKDYEDGGYQLVTLEKKRVAVKDERHYDFDGTFDGDSKQEDVFSSIAVPCLTHALNGFCSALMCYGQTGTGKSFTMCCTKPGLEGIIPRSAKFLFDLIKSNSTKKYTVTGQFIQIYRDQLGDLMTEGGRDKVDIHFDKDTGVTLTGCSSHVLTSEEDFMAFYEAGNSRRVVTATAMNPESSRGHSAMIIVIESKDASDESSPQIKGKITFIDLAGYERFSKTGISNSNPVMKDEAKTINASLLSLGHVVSALSNGDKHIPWRNAKLTRLLQDSIGGRSRTSIVLTIGPSSESLHETTNSLQFGQRAMAVKVSAKVNVTTDYEKLAAKLQSMLDERDEKINLLEVQIRSRDAERSEIAERHQRDEEELRERFRNEIEELKSRGGSIDQLRKVEDVFQVEVENLKEQQLEEVQYQEEAHNKQIVTLAAEQQRRERKKQVELQVAQERIIAEFERKLSLTGGNADLVDAMRQLSEKDALLATRASSIADLQERVAELSTMLSGVGVEAPVFEPLEETFIDLTQLEEIQARMESEITLHRDACVSLRSQLEALGGQLDSRAAEVVKLHREVERLQAELDAAGVAGGDCASPLLGPRGFVDTETLETQRVLMQAEIDRLSLENCSLKAEMTRLATVDSLVDVSTVQTPPPATPRAGRARAMSRIEGPRMVRKLPDVEAEKERKILTERVADMEKRLVTLSREYNLALKQNEALKGVCVSNALAVDDEFVDKEAGADVCLSILAARDAEIKSALSIIRRQEEQAAIDIQNNLRLESTALSLRKALEGANVSVPESMPLPDVSRSNMDTLFDFIESNRTIFSNVSAALLSSHSNTEQGALSALLSEKDSMLMLRERTIVEKEELIFQLAAVVQSMKAKLSFHGEPIELGADVQSAIAAAETLQKIAVSQATQQMEEALNRQKEEQERLERVLQTMSAERSNASQLIANAKKEAEQHAADSSALEKALSQQREALATASSDSDSLMSVVVDLKQKLLDKEDELSSITHALMKLQAERGVSESEGIFAAMRRKLRD